jgi:pSer/pThr/pTyr-binding forkhead associated (FHA) protein
MSGFDAEGYAVYLSFNPDNPKLIQDGMVIGRDSKSADLVMNDSSVSRRHARLFRKNGALMLEDLQSANGTVVNGRPLKAGMTVELPRQGNVVFGAVRLSLSGP